MPIETVALSISVLKKPIDDLYEQAQGAVKKELNKLRAHEKLKQLHRSATSVQKVKTLWRREKPINSLKDDS